MPVIESYCFICGSVTAYDRPPCPDGHGADCPERLCRHCGDAILVGYRPATGQGPEHAGHRVHRHQSARAA